MASSPTSLTHHLQPLILGLAALLSLLAFTILSVEGLLRKHVDPDLAEIESLQRRHLETYLADATFLSQSDLADVLKAAPPGETGDGGPSLNPKMYWGSDGASFGRAKPLVTPGTREFLLRYQNDWIKGRSFLERGRLKADLEVFDGLADFRYWNLELAPPLASIAVNDEFVPASKLPTPESLDLLSAVKVRLIKGSVDKEPLAALQTIRQFARLMMTTENYQLLTAGLAALEFERRAYRDFVDRGLIERSAWKPIDSNTTARASRAFAATMGYLRFATPTDVLLKVGLGEVPPPGFCAAINEQVPSELALRDQLGGLWPWERDYRVGYIALDKVIERAKSVCRLSIFRVHSEKHVYESADPDAPWPLASMPYFRTLFALRDWVAMPRRFEAYDRAAAR